MAFILIKFHVENKIKLKWGSSNKIDFIFFHSWNAKVRIHENKHQL